MSKRAKAQKAQGRRSGDGRSTSRAGVTKRAKPRPSSASLQRKLDLRTRELDEALERQTATAEVLRVIASSPRDLQAVLEAIAKTAARLLDVADAEIMRVQGDALCLVAKHGPIRQWWPLGDLRPINRNWVTGRAVVDRRPDSRLRARLTGGVRRGLGLRDRRWRPRHRASDDTESRA